ncbi:hypothetical protein HY483_03685 [Candidatus Woesearchaeota archaeon]|nr:hypothetical protein [Candidatus Woesearchaeota archaeon]
MIQLFFLLEYNLAPLQNLLRASGNSCFLPYEKEIGLSMNDHDPLIISKVVEHKNSLGIDRIIITRDTKFISHIGTTPVKLIILTDKTGKFEFVSMRLKQLTEEIISKGRNMMQRSEGHDSTYVECSKFYK